MAAIKKEDLEKLEAKYGLSEDGLTYQNRCSRITAVQKGESWVKPRPAEQRRAGIADTEPTTPTGAAIRTHPLYGKKILISPLLVEDQNRYLTYEEVVGHEIVVREAAAGEMIQGHDELDRVVADYEIRSENKSRPVVATACIPKSGQELSITFGKGLPGVPVVRGNDGQTGYIWAYPSQRRQIGDTVIQLHGLKTLITQIYPELLPKFSGKPVMSYVDGLVLVASIPQTEAILKAHRRQELQDAKLGLV